MEENKFLKNYQAKVSEQQKQDAALPAGWQETALVEPAPPVVQKPGSKGKKTVVAAAVLLALAGLVLLLFILLGRGVTVIDLEGWTLADARLWASDAGLHLKISEQYDDTYAAQLVFAQQPQPGAVLRKKDFLEIFVSLGHDLSVSLPIPPFAQMELAELEAWAEENFLTRFRLVTEYSDSVPAGRVIRHEINDPAVLDKIRRDTPIYVVVSKGQEPEELVLVKVPDFTGLSLAEARSLAKAEKLELDSVSEYDDEIPQGLIISQDKAADQELAQGSSIVVTISAGKKITVPDFSSLSQDRALALAAELGIASSLAERYSHRPAAAFLSQNLAAGAVYQPGDVLELVYSIGNKILLPDFTGQPRSALEMWAEEHNEKGAGLGLGFSQTQSNTAPGTIIYQNKKDIFVQPGTAIKATLSLGRLVYVPDFVAPAGSSYAQAVTRDVALLEAENAGLIPVFIAEKTKDRLPGEIWSQSLAAGKETYEDTVITLKYQPADVAYSVPDLTGQTEAEILAAGYLKKFKLEFIPAQEEQDGIPGTVSRQSIAAGKTVAAGTLLTLEILPEAVSLPPVEQDGVD